MTVKEFLLAPNCPVQHGEIASRMWPTNTNAKSYMSRKLSGKDKARTWTEKDDELCLAVLKKLAVDISALEKAGKKNT